MPFLCTYISVPWYFRLIRFEIVSNLSLEGYTYRIEQIRLGSLFQ